MSLAKTGECQPPGREGKRMPQLLKEPKGSRDLATAFVEPYGRRAGSSVSLRACRSSAPNKALWPKPSSPAIYLL